MTGHTIRNEPRYTNLQPGDTVQVDTLTVEQKALARRLVTRNFPDVTDRTLIFAMLDLEEVA